MKKFRFSIGAPAVAEVLIYDHEGSETLARVLDPTTAYTILDVRHVIYLFPSLFVRIIQLIWTYRHKPEYWEKARLRILYEFVLIQTVNPRVVICLSENNLRFGLLSRLYLDAEFIGVQNGYRQSEILQTARYNYLQNAYCFGNQVVDNYKLAGSGIKNYFVLGSLVDGLYRATNQNCDDKEYDICLISQYRYNRFYKEVFELKAITDLLLEYLQRYCMENNRRLCIASNSKANVFLKEKQYYDARIYTNDVDIVPNDRSNYSTYQTIDKSELSICINSTAGIEALGRKRKILFCNFSLNPCFDIQGKYRDGIWSLRDPTVTYESFSDRICCLLDMKKAAWNNQVREFVEYFIFCNDQPFPQDVLRRKINTILEK